MISSKNLFYLVVLDVVLVITAGVIYIHSFNLASVPLPNFLVIHASPEWDCDEDFIDIPDACKCWNDGYTADRFNQTRNDECIDKGNQYNAGFTAASKSEW